MKKMRRRSRRFRSGKRRTTTRVRGHYRKTPSGYKTYVRPHRRRVTKNVYKTVHYFIKNPLPIKPRFVERTGNSIFTALSMAFPQYSPIVEVGRFAFNNREKLISIFKTMLSNTTDREKIEHITSELEKGIKKEFSKEFSKRASSEITGMIDRQIGFTKVLQTLSKDFTERDVVKIRAFFDSTLENLILDSTRSVMGLG